jgi:hypothetical protein
VTSINESGVDHIANKRPEAQQNMQTENNFFKREFKFFLNFFGTKRCSFTYSIQQNLI